MQSQNKIFIQISKWEAHNHATKKSITIIQWALLSQFGVDSRDEICLQHKKILTPYFFPQTQSRHHILNGKKESPSEGMLSHLIGSMQIIFLKLILIIGHWDTYILISIHGIWMAFNEKNRIVNKLHFMGEIIVQIVFLENLLERGLNCEGGGLYLAP